MWSSGLQQHGSSLDLALSRWNVKGSVAIGGGSIWMSHVLQQQLDNISFSQTWCNVKGGLIFLCPRNEKVRQICGILEIRKISRDTQEIRCTEARAEEVTWPRSICMQADKLNVFIHNKQKEIVINWLGDSWLTLAMASTSAPFLSKQRTTSICPARAAMWRAVSPRWSPKTEYWWALRCCSKWCTSDNTF